MALSVANRLVDVVEFYNPDSEYAAELRGRVQGMQERVESRKRELIDLGRVEF